MSYEGYEYPTDSQLRQVRKWDCIADPVGLLSFMYSLWWIPEFGWHQKRRRFYISTGGWSGNEDLIDEWERTMFWSLCFVSERRGGHFVLHVPRFYVKVLPIISERPAHAHGLPMAEAQP